MGGNGGKKMGGYQFLMLTANVAYTNIYNNAQKQVNSANSNWFKPGKISKQTTVQNEGKKHTQQLKHN